MVHVNEHLIPESAKEMGDPLLRTRSKWSFTVPGALLLFSSSFASEMERPADKEVTVNSR